MYRIGEFSKMGQVSIKTLRYYDEIDLLKPEEIDILSGYRYYTTRQLVMLHEIQFYRQIGCSLHEIKQLLEENEMVSILVNRQKEIEERLRELSQQYKQIDLILNKEKIFLTTVFCESIPINTPTIIAPIIEINVHIHQNNTMFVIYKFESKSFT